MSDQNIDIVINTTAKTQGAEQAQQSLKKIDDQAKRSGSGVDALDKEVDQLTDRLLHAKIGSDEFREAQVKLTDALDRQRVAANAAAAASDRAGVAKGAVGGKASRAGLAVLELSRAFEDAQYGMAGVLNNIPTFLGALGVGAGIAGVASVAAVVLSKTLGPAFDELDEKLDLSGKASDARKEKAKELNEELGKAAQKATEAKFDQFLKEIDNVAEAQSILNERIKREIELQGELRRAREETYQSQLRLQESVINAEAGLGMISGDEAEAKRAALRAEMNEANLAAAKAAAEERRTNAAADLEEAEYGRWMAMAEKEAIQREAERQQLRYEALLEKGVQLQAQLAKARAAALDDRDRAIDQTVANAELGGGLATFAARTAAMYAIKPQDTFYEDALIRQNAGQLAGTADNLNKALDTDTNEVESKLKAAEQKLQAANENLAKTNESVDAKIQSLEEIAQNKDASEKLDELVSKSQETSEAIADKIGAAIKDVEPQNRLQKESLEQLQSIIKDNQVTAEESRKVSALLSNLSGLLRTDFTGLVQLLTAMQADQAVIADQLKKLKEQQARLSAIVQKAAYK